MKALASHTNEAKAFLLLCAIVAAPRVYDKDPSQKMLDLMLEYLEQAEPLMLDTKLVTKTWFKKALRLNKKNFWDLEYDLFVDDEQDSIVGRWKKANLKSHPDFSKQESKFLTLWYKYMRTEDEAARAQLIKLVGSITPELAKFFKSKVSANEYTAIQAQLKSVIKDLVGKPQDLLTIEQSAKAREADPDTYKIYLALRRQLNANRDEVLAQLFRANGRMKIADIKVELDKLGIDSNSVPDFNGLQDEQGYYTIYGEPLNGKPTGTCVMNPEYKKGSSVYVLKCQAPGAKTFQAIYTKEAVQNKRSTKFEKVSTNIPKLEKAHKTWLKQMLAGNEEALVTEILYLTSARIGSVGNATAGSPTYGISTLLKKHVKIKGNSLVFNYPGKKGQTQIHTIEASDKSTKYIVNEISKRLKELKPSEPIFTTNRTNVGKYVKSLGLDITPHKLRTMHGTLLMKQLLDEQREILAKKPKDKTVLAAFKACALEVGKLLGHFAGSKLTGTTAIKNYIDPQVMVDFFNDYNVQLPPVVEALL